MSVYIYMLAMVGGITRRKVICVFFSKSSLWTTPTSFGWQFTLQCPVVFKYCVFSTFKTPQSLWKRNAEKLVHQYFDIIRICINKFQYRYICWSKIGPKHVKWVPWFPTLGRQNHQCRIAKYWMVMPSITKKHQKIQWPHYPLVN